MKKSFAEKKYLGICLLVILSSFSSADPIYQRVHSALENKRIQRAERERNRWQWQMPNRVMDELGIKAGQIIGDVGAGDGYFTFRLAERIGQTGRIYASDIDSQALQGLKAVSREKRLENITVILGTDCDPKLPAKSMDMILMVNVIHLVNEPTLFLQNITKSLKPGAYLVIIQWDAEKMGKELKGWKKNDRALYSMRTNLRKIYTAGLEVERILDFLPLQKIYICVPVSLIP